MQQRPLGRTGLSVSVVGLGTWQLGGEWGISFSQDAADAILDTAADCGINLIDTAECYGDHLSERLIGDYLARRDRSRWIVATKFGHHFTGHLSRQDDFSAAGAMAQLEASLRALRVEQIDLYQFHSGPDAAFHDDALWTALDKARQAGLIAHVGLSINKTTTIQAEEARSRGIESIQVVYNRLDDRAERVHFPAALRDGLGVLARVPLASGLLTGKYAPGARFGADDPRAKLSAEELTRALLQVEEIGMHEVPSGVPMAQWAIAWCLRHSAVSTVIPGAKNPAQVRANALAAELGRVSND